MKWSSRCIAPQNVSSTNCLAASDGARDGRARSDADLRAAIAPTSTRHGSRLWACPSNNFVARGLCAARWRPLRSPLEGLWRPSVALDGRE